MSIKLCPTGALVESRRALSSVDMPTRGATMIARRTIHELRLLPLCQRGTLVRVLLSFRAVVAACQARPQTLDL
jgi:hypothetical protein